MNDKKQIKISEILPGLLKNKGVSVRQASKATKIPQSTLNSWVQKNAKPNDIVSLKVLADYLGVSVDFLLWAEKQKTNLNELETDILLSGLFKIRLEKIKEK